MRKKFKTYREINPHVNLFKYFTSAIPTKNPLKHVILTSRGRDAIEIAMTLTHLTKNDTVLLPALTCDTVTIPFQRTCKVTYYDLKYDYSLDFDCILYHIKNSGRIKLLYIINYFGFVQKGLDRIHDICKLNGILLVEDQAHSALSTSHFQFFDIKIFSFRKLFPTPDGGGIWIKGKEIQNLNVSFKSIDYITSVLKGSIIALKRNLSYYSWFRNIAENHWRNEKYKSLHRDNKRSVRVLPISYFTKNIIFSADLKAISEERRKQYFIWLSLFSETEFESVFCSLDKYTVPYCFTIKISNQDEIYNHFKRFKIFLKVHWRDLPDESKETCPISNELSRFSISLPIYPGLKYTEMRFIRDEIVKIGISTRH